MKKSLFAGLSILEPGESLSADNGAFTGRDREAEDRLLELGAKTHRHDGSSGVATPSAGPIATMIASGGTLPPSTSITLGYTLEDIQAGETTLSPVAVVSTRSAVEAPPSSPVAKLSTASGSLVVDTYYYATTFTDAEGGETPLGPAVSVQRPPNFANAQVLLSGLTNGLASAGASGWRLYRAVGGASYNLLATGTSAQDTFTDDGSHSLDCSTHPPAGSENTTSGTSQLQVTLPNVADSRVAFINLYATVSGDFSGGSFLGRFPVASGGAVALFRSLELGIGVPPPVNRSYGGAHQIDPDTELLDWHWKRPVLTSAALPSGSLGDVRLVENTGSLYGVLAPGGASAAGAWTKLASAGGGGPGIANLIVRGSAVGSIQSEIETIEFPNFTVTASGAHKAVVRADVTKADLIAEEVARASGDITERNLRVAADAAEAGLRASGDLGQESFTVARVAAEAGLRASGDINQEKVTIAQVAAEAGLRSSGDLNEKTAREGISSLLLGSGVGYVHHGAASAVPRPSGFKTIVWEGAVEPANATTEDLVVYENSQAVHVPAAGVYKAAGQAIANATLTVLTFDSERYDNSEIHSTSSNTSRLTAPKAGVYMLDARMLWPSNATGVRFMTIRLNGSETKRIAAERRAAIENTETTISAVFFLNAGDYIEILGYQTSGGSLTTEIGGAELAPQEASITWLGTGLRTSEPVDWGIVEALPASAELGDFCTLKVAANTFWRLQKVDATTYPWAVIHGPALPFSLSSPGSPGTTYTTMATVNVPAAVKMIADIEFGFSGSSSVGGTQLRAAIFYAAVEKAISNAIFVSNPANNNGAARCVALEQEIPASTVVNMKVKTDQANASTWFLADLLIRPRRVG